MKGAYTSAFVFVPILLVGFFTTLYFAGSSLFQRSTDNLTHEQPLIAVMNDLWTKVEKPELQSPPEGTWEPVLTPPIPEIWMPETITSPIVIYYASAQKMDMTISDGVRVSKPWLMLRVDVEKKEILAAALLITKLEDNGIQGVRPLTGEEVEIMKNSDSAQEALIRLVTATSKNSPDDEALVKKYYCLWKSTQGIASDLLKEYSFDDWLACSR